MKYFNSSFELGPIKELPILKQTTKILRISYPHNAIQKINPALSKAHNTEQLDLSYNQISTIQPVLELRKLRILCLSYNHIANIPKGILKLKKLEVIDLSHNHLCFMPNVNPVFELYRIRKGELQVMLQGNKVMDDHHSEIEEKMLKIKQQVKKLKDKIESKYELKQLQISSKSVQMHKRTNSQPVSEQKTLSQILPNAQKHPGSLSDAKLDIQASMASLNQFKRKFEVIVASEFKGWSEILNGLFKKEAESVKSLVEAYRQIIISLTTQFVNPSEATAKIQIGFIQASEIQQLIKDQHSVMLEALSQSEVPMTSYKIWVQLYRDLRGLAERIRWQAWGVIQCEIRNQQIEALKLISPSKPEKNNTQKEDKLEGLLFSKNKQIQIEEKVECSQCFIKNEEVKQLRETVELLSQENSELKQKLQDLQKINEKLTKQEDLLGKQLKKRQEQIIGAISDKIDASVYQKVLLEQAKGIEDLIKCDRHLLKRERNLLQNTQKFADLCQTATAIAKDKTIGECKEGVSQFYLQDQQKYSANSGLMKMPYFNNNKNTENSSLNYKKSKRNTQNSVSSTQKKRKFSLQKGQRNQYGSMNSRSSNLISRKTTQKVESEESAKKLEKKITKSNQIDKYSKLGENNVIISDFAITETGKQIKYQVQESNGRKALAELIARKTNDSNKYFNMKNIKNNQAGSSSEVGDKNYDENKIKKGQIMDQDDKIEVENYETYVPMDYHSVNLKKDEEPYEKYMRFHLRNNIMETLQKKGKRYSLAKLTTKIASKQKQKQTLTEDSKKNSARISEHKLKSTQRIKINQKQRGTPQSNIKSYVEILGKLRN